MVSIHLKAKIRDDHTLELDIPKDLPPGEVEVTIHLPLSPHDLTSLKAKLAAQGLLEHDFSHIQLPDDFVEMSPEALLNLTHGIEAGSSLEMIQEDRLES